MWDDGAPSSQAAPVQLIGGAENLQQAADEQGAPIAGYLLDASGGSNAGINPFRPGMFYAGGLAVFSSLILMQTRLKIGGLDLKRKI